MGKMNYRCGNWISTNSENPSYQADLLPEAGWDDVHEAVLEQVKALVQLVKEGKEIADFTDTTGSDPQVTEPLLVNKIFGTTFVEFSRQVFQCEKCGRLLVESSQPNVFHTFLPESAEAFTILAAKQLPE